MLMLLVLICSLVQWGEEVAFLITAKRSVVVKVVVVTVWPLCLIEPITFFVFMFDFDLFVLFFFFFAPGFVLLVWVYLIFVGRQLGAAFVVIIIGLALKHLRSFNDADCEVHLCC